jgi:hypothetical protein
MADDIPPAVSKVDQAKDKIIRTLGKTKEVAQAQVSKATTVAKQHPKYLLAAVVAFVAIVVIIFLYREDLGLNSISDIKNIDPSNILTKTKELIIPPNINLFGKSNKSGSGAKKAISSKLDDLDCDDEGDIAESSESIDELIEKINDIQNKNTAPKSAPAPSAPQNNPANYDGQA